MSMSVWMAALDLVLDPQVLIVILGAAIFGLLIGCIPGLTATMATALLVPLTFFMPPVPAVAAIVTATAMAIFSGDIPGALLRIPGTPASAAYANEAYQMTIKGQAGARYLPGVLCYWRFVWHLGINHVFAVTGRICAAVFIVRIFLVDDSGIIRCCICW
jgi:hypothetical protein